MRAQALGGALGVSVCIGVLLVMGWLRARRRPGLMGRIGPFIVGMAPPARTGWELLVDAARPSRGIAAGGGIGTRLARSGSSASAGQYRLEQVAWAAAGACIGGGLALMVTGAPVVALALSVSGSLAGILARDRRLAGRARDRRRRIDQHLPALAEILAFAVAAGESPFAALQRAGSSMTGDLADEVAVAVADARSGRSLEDALAGMSDRTGSADVARFVDALVVALERGTPLADVLRAQASDARSDSRRRLMEQAGRKDVAMLVPVVFLILPTVVAIALYPALQSLRLVVP